MIAVPISEHSALSLATTPFLLSGGRYDRDFRLSTVAGVGVEGGEEGEGEDAKAAARKIIVPSITTARVTKAFSANFRRRDRARELSGELKR